MFSSTTGVFTTMEFITGIISVAGLFITIGIALTMYWLKRNQENNKWVKDRLGLLITKDDMKEYVELSQAPLIVRLDIISSEIRGIRQRGD